MPKITEPTVAEHRAKQRAAILRAAEEIAVERGGAAVTVAAVAARTGLARPSVYAYFPSAQDMLAALVLAGFERWRAAIAHADSAVATPHDRIRAYFRTAAARAAAGDHRLAAALSGVPLPDPVRATLLAGHRESAEPLTAAARDLGVTDLDRALALLQTVVTHCLTRVEAGHDPRVEAEVSAGFALGGLEHLAGPTRPAPGGP